MEDVKNVPLIISLPKPYRDLMLKIAAEQTLSNPEDRVSLSRLGREILIDHLNQKYGEVINHE
jgi:hypothetical protein